MVLDMNASNQKRMVIYVSSEMFEHLEKLAKADGRSVSNYSRNVLAKYLENIKAEKQ